MAAADLQIDRHVASIVAAMKIIHGGEYHRFIERSNT